MKKLSTIYKEAGIAFTFPIVIKDSNGNETYYEDETDYWHRKEYDENGKETYFVDNFGYWRCKEYDGNGKLIYFENSSGYWQRKEYDDNGNETYFEDSNGEKRGTKRQSCDGKFIEVDGKKYKLVKE